MIDKDTLRGPAVNMNSLARKMLFSCLFCYLTSMVVAQNEYLPPNKGYAYPTPIIPFITVKPTPPPFRTTTPRNGYLPPVTQPAIPTPREPEHPHPHEDHGHDHHHHHEPGMPFDFAYAVNEDGNDYSHNAKSDGDVTRGEYRIALPDGRTQIVRYTADWKNGFNAEVTYEGEARYPDQPNGGYPSGPSQTYVPPNQGYQY